MAGLTNFIVAQTEASARRLSAKHPVVSGIILRRDGAQFLVNVGGQTMACAPALGLPLLPGDQVLVRVGFGQPAIVATSSRNEGVT